jgi:excisionase family DNA binding protein
VSDTTQGEIPPLFISVPDAARLLGISETACWRLVRDNKIPSAKINRSRRVSLQALRDYHDERIEAAGEAS